jgi:hypothetical protein
MISCYDVDYANSYIKNLNNKTFKKYFKVFKSDNPDEINEIYNKVDKKIIIFITKLPEPILYSFDFIKDIYHIHLAIPFWKIDSKLTKDDYNVYLSEIQKIPIQKFVNVKNTSKIYDNQVEDKIFNIIISLINKKLNNEDTIDEKYFPRMPHTGGKLVVYDEREISI